jgi:cell division protein FtsB
MDTGPIPIPQETERARYIGAALCEVRMLVDYLAASSVRTLNDVQISDPGSTVSATLSAGELLLRLDEIEMRTSYPRLQPSDLALVQTARNALGQLVRPASGLTIAYTALVVGNRRGKGSQSRATLAQEAYPGLVSIAIAHRWAQRLLLVIAVLLTLSAVWESAKVALGKSLLESLAALRTEQTTIAAEKARLEATLDNLPNGVITPATIMDQGYIVPAAFALCDRGRALEYFVRSDVTPKNGAAQVLQLRLSPSPLIRDVCGRDAVVAQNIEVVRDDLVLYRTYWPGMVGNAFSGVAQVASIPCRLFICRPTPHIDLPSGQSRLEYLFAPALLVWGNYLLPVIFGFLGAAIFVILDFFGKIRDGRLDPRDNFLGWIRLVLGLTTGAAVGLFFSAYTPPPAASGATTNLIGSLALTASAVAFLAGFGVEGVFSMLESLVTRVFASEGTVSRG